MSTVLSERGTLRLDQLVEFLVHMVWSGGPDPSQYRLLNRWFDVVTDALNEGHLSQNDLAYMRLLLGEACTPKTMQGFAYHKPHGYAGDYEMLDRIYQSHIASEPLLRKWDMFFHSLPAPRAVRNRGAYLTNLAYRLYLNLDRPIRVLNIASGPGREMAACCAMLPMVKFDCVEQDQNAIVHAEEVCHEYRGRITFTQANALRYRPKQTYDLIWVSGLCDYLSDRLIARLVKRLRPMLWPGGELVIGNFADGDNPTRHYMELFEWNLIHRTEQQLKDLALACDIPCDRIAVQREAERVNLFLHVQGGMAT